MKICEICGTNENLDNVDQEQMESVMLHICQSYLEDRKWSRDEFGAF